MHETTRTHNDIPTNTERQPARKQFKLIIHSIWKLNTNFVVVIVGAVVGAVVSDVATLGHGHKRVARCSAIMALSYRSVRKCGECLHDTTDEMRPEMRQRAPSANRDAQTYRARCGDAMTGNISRRRRSRHSRRRRRRRRHRLFVRGCEHVFIIIIIIIRVCVCCDLTS